MLLTKKQQEYVVKSQGHRWSFAVGAVRSGKSFLAILYTIPTSIVRLRGKKGLNIILGSTRDNIERNVLTPMRDLLGADIATGINQRNECYIAGERVLCIGAEKANQVARLRGSEIKFCYCDEIADIHPDVFQILKSRLSLPYSVCHAACNPESPQHYIKRFIDSAPDAGIDLYYQHYTIDDNPFLPAEYVASIKAEYAGTVYYKRYIEGLWAQAEGLIYPMYENALVTVQNEYWLDYCISLDYGTQNATAGLLWAFDGSVWYAIREYYYSGRTEGHQKTDEDYVQDMIDFCSDIPGNMRVIVDPSAASFIAALRRSGKFTVQKARNDVLDGIRETGSAMQRGLVKIDRSCKNLIAELQGYCWDESSASDKPLKIADHACDSLRYLVSTKHLVRHDNKYNQE